jgi:TRAP-type C4-dicarboxylate transport system permease large subunit
MSFMQKLEASSSLIPVVLLIAAVLGSIYTGFATATEAAAVGVVGSLALSAMQGTMSWSVFKQALMGATRLYCMIALILAGAAFLTLSMGYIGLPRHLAEWIGGLGLSPFLARVFSIAGAMVVSWLAHRTLSFGVKVAPTLAEFLQFAVLGASAAVLNYATFSFLLWAGWVEKSFLALIASSLVAMIFSYCGMRFGVFRKTHSLK